jgi:hypothetical protein
MVGSFEWYHVRTHANRATSRHTSTRADRRRSGRGKFGDRGAELAGASYGRAMTTRSAPPAPLAPAGRPARDPGGIAVKACTRFAAHLMLLSHQNDDEREHLAAALNIAERAMTSTATAAGIGIAGVVVRAKSGTEFSDF